MREESPSSWDRGVGAMALDAGSHGHDPVRDMFATWLDVSDLGFGTSHSVATE